MKRILALAALAAMTTLAAPATADVHVNIGVAPPVVVQPMPPPMVVQPVPPRPVMVAQPIPPPPGAIVVVPPLPPGIVIGPGPAVYWFWDDNVSMWFYFDARRHRHYDRHHEFIDDGRHYYVGGKRWKVGHEDMGRHKGWYKDQEKRERKEEKRELKEEKHRYKHKGKHGDD